MKKPALLPNLSRRQFCGGVATCVGVVTIAGCSDSSTGNDPDAGTPPPPDASGNMGTCSASGVIDVGAPSSFVSGKPVYVSTGGFFVVRDSGGIYALTAKCTHEGATTVVQSGDFFCPRHGAQFDFNGNVISGPVSRGLVHYNVCLLANGHVGVNTAQQVMQSQRLNA